MGAATKTGLVLVVDDDESIRGFLSDLLVDEGFDVVEARDGEEAMRRLEQARPALILLDIGMPKIDGYEVCRRVKASPVLRDIPVVVISAGAREPAARAAGCDDFVAKPFDLDEILATIGHWIRA